MAALSGARLTHLAARRPPGEPGDSDHASGGRARTSTARGCASPQGGSGPSGQWSGSVIGSEAVRRDGRPGDRRAPAGVHVLPSGGADRRSATGRAAIRAGRARPSCEGRETMLVPPPAVAASNRAGGKVWVGRVRRAAAEGRVSCSRCDPPRRVRRESAPSRCHAQPGARALDAALAGLQVPRGTSSDHTARAPTRSPRARLERPSMSRGRPGPTSTLDRYADDRVVRSCRSRGMLARDALETGRSTWNTTVG